MGRFDSKGQDDASDSSRGKYNDVNMDETKLLNGSDSDVEYPVQQILELNRSLRRTKFLLRLVVGTIGVSILLFIIVVSVAGAKRDEILKLIGGKRPDRIMKSPVPPLPLETVTFVEEKIYGMKSTPESDEAWNRLLPDGRGFVYIPDWEDYDLPPGQDTPWGVIYSTALYHQIHCLGQIRKYAWMMVDGISSDDPAKLQAVKEHVTGKDHPDHLYHCFDYLRQSLMCCGDMAMEWPRTEETGERYVVDGWNIPHECKSRNGIEEYMRKAHFNHSQMDEIAPHR
ncbi:hypothetical protein P152DRAFT_462238 [Eremomyces bilateralis CBS 781.70]|uniref:Tat pathway signal sequence n=1 Tax=Eremomyces bilateralis CBS 781.70 TaxID=1392243 RepID=A0A6G1FS42_9PEZI|nr:uncharacterized protein P152DRAFT_462238 [Eremomyces bilateralis CBS 781.70]KAF1808675.1 hypothetical protein P152DRAFT_462238 [Eremomyces bilateralis CBS 781.70]